MGDGRMTFIRKLDGSGRVVIPATIRDLLGVVNGEEIEFVVNSGHVLVRRPDYDEDKKARKIVAEQLRKYGYAVPPEFQ